MLKSLARSFLLRRGLELKQVGAPIRGHANFISHLRAKGFRPGTVVDVGVAAGTPWLYRFPDAQLVLVEPNDQFMPDLERIRQQHRADIHLCAAGREPGTMALNVDMVAPSSSSLFAVSDDLKGYWRRRDRECSLEPRLIEVKPLDSLLPGRYRPPYLIKIDTEGFELEALCGATESLKHTGYLVVEASVSRRHVGSYEFADLIQFLASQGFRLCDIVDVAVFDRTGDICYMDAAFTRIDGGSPDLHPGPH